MTAKNNKKKRNGSFRLTIFYSLISFLGIVIDIILCVIMINVLVRAEAISVSEEYVPDFQGTTFLMATMSLVLGCILTVITNIIVIKPINTLIKAIRGLASGDFSTRLKFSRLSKRIPDMANVINSFNTLAEELSNTEILRSDFINNFSHEFKTPLTSISGFAKLVRHADISDKEREQYLIAIEEESSRLAHMSSNVLLLTKVENQTILKDTENFNLSEQIRNSFLLLESGWKNRDIEFELDFEEYFIIAAEELLKEVWINLIDNAIKFTPDGGRISVEIFEEGESIIIRISNTGDEISSEKIGKIFRKFYQCDESHSSSGNGIGLAIVKRIVDLHGGTVTAKSDGGVNTFTVILPRI